MRRRLLVASVAAACALAVAVLAADALFPPDLGRARATSTVVLGADHAMLRPFETADGKWRLAARADEVDQRYLTLLGAWTIASSTTTASIRWRCCAPRANG